MTKQSVLMRLQQSLRPEERAPTCPPTLATPLFYVVIYLTYAERPNKLPHTSGIAQLWWPIVATKIIIQFYKKFYIHFNFKLILLSFEFVLKNFVPF